MALTVGTDTYISRADADTYVAAHYMSGDATRQRWEAMAEADKEVLLRNAATMIDAQVLAGIKRLPTQKMAFPRMVESGYLRGMYDQMEVPDDIKAAQVEIALQAMAGESKREQMRLQGVKSYSIGNLSETLASGSAGQPNITSGAALILLRPYLAGGVAL